MAKKRVPAGKLRLYRGLVPTYDVVYVEASSKKEAYELIKAGDGDVTTGDPGDPIRSSIELAED